MKFIDLVVEYSNVLSDEFCDDLISKFDSDDRSHPGVVGGGFSPEVKDSLDLNFSSLDDWNEYDSKMYSTFSPYVNKYTKFLGDNFGTNYAGITDSGYQIQKTTPGGRYVWHNDDCINIIDDKAATQRYATYIFYLNDVPEENGGATKFLLGGEEYTIRPTKGTLLLFPSFNLYTHCGETLESGVKYLVTGWLLHEVPYENLS